jgi:hypothetical protein
VQVSMSDGLLGSCAPEQLSTTEARSARAVLEAPSTEKLRGLIGVDVGDAFNTAT